MNKLKRRKSNTGGKSKYESLTGTEDSPDGTGTGAPTPAGPLPIREEDKSVEQKEKEAAFIIEQTVDKVGQMATNNLSWANAALLAVALPTTIEINTWSDVGNAWFYFIIIFIVAILIAFVPRLWEDPEEVARELELSDKEKFEKAKNRASRRGSLVSEDITWVDKDGRKQKKAKEIYSDGIQVNEVLSVVEVEADALGEALEDLVLATAANVVALALSTAAKDTFESIIDEDDDGLTTTAYVFYAIFLTICATILSFWLGSLYEQYETQMYLDIVEQGYSEAKDEMIAFSLRKRALKLTLSTTAMIMAWAWRDAFKNLILSMYSGDTESLAHMWVYCLTTTAFVTFNNAVCRQYDLIVPKSDKVKHLQMGSQGRKNLGTMFSANVNFICALAWYDAITDSFDEIDDWDNWVKTLFYWITALFMEAASLVLSYYWERYRLKVAIAEKGLAHTLVTNFKKIFHHPQSNISNQAPSVIGVNQNQDLLSASAAIASNSKEQNKLINPNEVDEYHAFVWVLTDEFMKLWTLSCGTAASLFVTLSLKYTIAAAYSDVGYDIGDTVKRSDVWAVWIALIVSLIISTLVVQYLSKLLNALKRERKEKEKKEVEVKLMKENENVMRDSGSGNSSGIGNNAGRMNREEEDALVIDTGSGNGSGNDNEYEEDDVKSRENIQQIMDKEYEEDEERRKQDINNLGADTGTGMADIALDAGDDAGDAGDAGGDDAGDASGSA